MAPPSEQVHKPRPTRFRRFLRLLGGAADPRAWIHAVRIVNYYNYAHVVPRRELTTGPACRISPNVILSNPRQITIGARMGIGARAYLWAGPRDGRIVIGDDVLIGPTAMITAASYRFNDGSPVNDQAMDEAEVRIGNDVWIGYGAVVLPGARIGDGAIIGAGAVVRGEIPPGAIVAPAPTAVVGQRRMAGDDLSAPDRAAPADRDVLAAIRAECPTLDAAALDRPLDETGIDSFDMITLRTAIEAQQGATIPDREWYGIETLSDIARLPSLAGGAHAPAPQAEAAPKATTGQARRRYTVNMPQMALSGLSESWTFKELGDLHWQMITDFLQSPSSAIADENGDRLYATFTRLRLEVPGGLRGIAENAPLEIASRLERFGGSMFFGHHEGRSGQAGLSATTMSTFARHGSKGDNTSLVKGAPHMPDPDALPALAEFPEFGTEYRARRAADPAPALFECDYDMLPCHDINGVGLLYFAAYPSIMDLCLERAEGRGFLADHDTVLKDICYFANAGPEDTIRFRLHAREETHGLIRHVATLSRASDGVRMAEITCAKRRA